MLFFSRCKYGLARQKLVAVDESVVDGLIADSGNTLEISWSSFSKWLPIKADTIISAFCLFSSLVVFWRNDDDEGFWDEIDSFVSVDVDWRSKSLFDFFFTIIDLIFDYFF